MTPSELDATINSIQCRIDVVENVLTDLVAFAGKKKAITVRHLKHRLQDAGIL